MPRDGDLFITKVPDPKLPGLDRYPLADAYGELELLCSPLSDPFSRVDIVADPAAPRVRSKTVPAREMSACAGQRVQMLGYMIHVKGTDTHTGQRMSFGWFIDKAGDFRDSKQFPDVSARFPFRGRGVYRLVGHVEDEFGHYSLRTQFMETFPWRIDPRYGEK